MATTGTVAKRSAFLMREMASAPDALPDTPTITRSGGSAEDAINASEPLGLTWPTIHQFLRLGTNAAFPGAMSDDEAIREAFAHHAEMIGGEVLADSIVEGGDGDDLINLTGVFGGGRQAGVAPALPGLGCCFPAA